MKFGEYPDSIKPGFILFLPFIGELYFVIYFWKKHVGGLVAVAWLVFLWWYHLDTIYHTGVWTATAEKAYQLFKPQGRILSFGFENEVITSIKWHWYKLVLVFITSTYLSSIFITLGLNAKIKFDRDLLDKIKTDEFVKRYYARINNSEPSNESKNFPS
ncbi:MAG: hypothetical protein Q4A60_01750 [Pasteurellaceae bacterium]|nr:hypothetical protein [Pasteurellaceae bacterium]